MKLLVRTFELVHLQEQGVDCEQHHPLVNMLTDDMKHTVITSAGSEQAEVKRFTLTLCVVFVSLA